MKAKASSVLAPIYDLTTAGRMTDVNGVLQIEMGSHRREIIGVVIHVMAISRLRRSAVAAPVMSNHAVTLIDKE